MLSTHQAQEVLGVRRCIGKNPSSTWAKNKTKLEYTSEGQPSPFELTFGVELRPNSHSKKMAREIAPKDLNPLWTSNFPNYIKPKMSAP